MVAVVAVFSSTLKAVWVIAPVVITGASLTLVRLMVTVISSSTAESVAPAASMLSRTPTVIV